MNREIKLCKMKKEDIAMLFEIALDAFERDKQKYGVYPPLLQIEKKKFLPPLVFGKKILLDTVVIGGMFVLPKITKGEIGAIFISPKYQGKGYGKEALLELERAYPRIKRWTLETPSDSKELHQFYEEVGYCKIGERMDKKSKMKGYVYEKSI